jgi:agmatine deiminase
LVPDLAAKQKAEEALKGLEVRFHQAPFGDIWLRDTGPLFLYSEKGEVVSIRFQMNGWGGKYILPGDDSVALKIGELTGLYQMAQPWVLEGGSIEVDGEGTCLTTRQCLLNPNRNPGLTQSEIEKNLQILGIRKTLWISQGLLNDHTDGHIDNIARFVTPGVVLCMETHDRSDPNQQVLHEIFREISLMTDAQGRKLQVIRIPSPGAITDSNGQIMPASYLNFLIGNRTVAVPTYGSAFDAEAVATLASCFPSRKVIGLPANSLLLGGGAFHCISQQQPQLKKN